MKFALPFLILSSCYLLSLNSMASIYGADDRLPIRAAPAALQNLGSSILLMVPKPNILMQQKTFDLATAPQSETMGLCEGIKDRNAPSFVVGCTGFLIADDLLITAGHCMSAGGEIRNTVTPHCRDFAWITDFKEDFAGVVPLKNLPLENAIECKEVIYAIHETERTSASQKMTFGRDFAIVKLAKKLHRTPLKLSEKPVEKEEPLQMIGYPMAGPLTIAGHAKILSIESGYYRSNLDAFPGNSGSPVFNQNREVIGILVRGYPESFISDTKNQCNALNSCDQSATQCLQNDGQETPGEHIQPIHFVKEML